MVRTVKHFSLHRIAGTELRVVADIEVGPLPVIQAEESVIRGYARQALWPHESVTLLILQDLKPLVRQLRAGTELPPGGAAAHSRRPVVNAYDLADMASCHVFVNWRALVKEGYADDPVAIEGLLAHEHAHPLAENDATRASRCLKLRMSVQNWPPSLAGAPDDGGQHVRSAPGQPGDRRAKLQRLLVLLAEKLALYGPREIFANEQAIAGGFAECLHHLDQRTVANAVTGVAGREALRQQLLQEVDRGTLTSPAVDLLLLIGDLRGYVDLAMEVAPFCRAGRPDEARGLEGVLEAEIFPHLDAEVPRLYGLLRDHYVALRADSTPDELMIWAEGVLAALAQTLAARGLVLRPALRMAAR